jgi:hypothetical protein
VTVKHKIILLIFGSYLVGTIFTAFEFDAVVRKKWHPFYQGHTYENGEYWDGKVTNAVFVYGFMEMVSRAMIFCAAYLAVRHRIFIYLFYVCGWIEIADMFDYWLFRNDPYPFLPKIGNFGLEFNYVKLFLVGIYSTREWRTDA